MFDLTLQIAPEGLYGFRRDTDGWRSCRLSGSYVLPLDESQEDVLDMLFLELHTPTGRALHRLHLVFADTEPCRNWMLRLFQLALPAGFAHVQALALEPFLARAAQWGDDVSEMMPSDRQWSLAYLLPLLDYLLLQPVQHHMVSDAALRARESEMNELRLKNAELEMALQQSGHRFGLMKKEHLARERDLQVQIARSTKPPKDELVFFLPLFFRHFWQKMRTDELGQLLRTFDMPSIVSPFPEPDSAMLSMMRKRFVALPEPVRQEVLAFVRDLAAHFDIRTESLTLLEQP